MDSVYSFKTNHFGRHKNETRPSSLTATVPLRTTFELLTLPELRSGDPPMPVYDGAYAELEGDDMPTENEEL